MVHIDKFIFWFAKTYPTIFIFCEHVYSAD